MFGYSVLESLAGTDNFTVPMSTPLFSTNGDSIMSWVPVPYCDFIEKG